MYQLRTLYMLANLYGTNQMLLEMDPIALVWLLYNVNAYQVYMLLEVLGADKLILLLNFIHPKMLVYLQINTNIVLTALVDLYMKADM